MLMYQANTVGESSASPVINTLTVGAKPAPPPAAAFIRANSSLAVLRLDTWQQPACPILYFVIEYKLSSAPAWTMGRLQAGCCSDLTPLLAVTNSLQLQDVYSLRGLGPSTTYDLRVTGHNHAGSSSAAYTFTTLTAAGQPAHQSPGLAAVLAGLGLRASLSIFISVVCLVLASLGVCFCIRKSE